MASEEEKAPRKERSALAAFLGMLLSALVSLFIAGTMFTVGSVHRKLADDRERRALIHFLAVEAADMHAEVCNRANGLFLGYRFRKMTSPRMAGARTLGHVMSLDADPSLVATLRSIYGRHAQVTSDLELAYAFYKDKKKLTQNQIKRVIVECKGMGVEVAKVIEIAEEEGVDRSALSALEAKGAEAVRLTDALVKQQDRLLPDLKLSVIAGGTRPGTVVLETPTRALLVLDGQTLGRSCRIEMTNFYERAVEVTGTSCSLAGVKVGEAHRTEMTEMTNPYTKQKYMGKVRKEIKGDLVEMKPGETVSYSYAFPGARDLPAGPFEGTITVDTDCPGYERLTVAFKGTALKVLLAKGTFSGPLDEVTLQGSKAALVKAYNYSDRPVTVTGATCSLAGVTVSLPRGNVIKPQQGATYPHVEIRLEPSADAPPAALSEGTLTVETDSPGQERITLPVKVAAPK